MGALDKVRPVAVVFAEILACYRHLAQLIKVQIQAVETGDEARLTQALQEKDSVIARVQGMEAEIRRRSAGAAGGERERWARETAPLRAGLEAALLDVIALEKHCEGILESMKTDLARQIKTLRQSQNALKGYDVKSRTDFFRRQDA